MNTDIFNIPAQIKLALETTKINKEAIETNKKVLGDLYDRANTLAAGLANVDIEKRIEEAKKKIDEDLTLAKLNQELNKLKEKNTSEADESTRKVNELKIIEYQEKIEAREIELAEKRNELEKTEVKGLKDLLYALNGLALDLKDKSLNEEERDELIRDYSSKIDEASKYVKVLPELKDVLADTEDDVKKYITSEERQKAIDHARIDQGITKSRHKEEKIDIKEKATQAVSWFNRATNYAEGLLGVIGVGHDLWQAYGDDIKQACSNFVDSISEGASYTWEKTKEYISNGVTNVRKYFTTSTIIAANFVKEIGKGSAKWIGEKLSKAGAVVSKSLKEGWLSKVGNAAKWVGSALGKAAKGITKTGLKAGLKIGKWSTYLMGPFGTAIRTVSKGLGKVGSKIPGLLKGFSKLVKGAGSFLKTGFSKMAEAAKGLFSKVKDIGGGIWNRIKGAGKAIADSSIGKKIANSSIGKLGKFVGGVAKKVAGSSVGKFAGKALKWAAKPLMTIPGVGQAIALGLTAWDTIDNYRAFKTIFPNASFAETGIKSLLSAAASQFSFGLYDPMEMTRDVADAIKARKDGKPNYELEEKILKNGGHELLRAGFANNNLEPSNDWPTTPASSTVEKSSIKGTGIDSVAKHDYSVVAPQSNTSPASSISNVSSSSVSNVEYNNTYAASTMANNNIGNGQYKEGWISELGETGKVGGGSTSTISSGRGDYGGASYGKHQFASTNGVVQEFIKQSGFANEFAGLRPGTAEFNNKWKQLAENKDFQAAEEAYYQKSYVQPIVSKLQKQGMDISNDPVMKELAISSSVQFGSGGASSIFAEAFRGKDYNSLSTEDKIKILSAYKKSDDFVARKFRSSSANVRAGVQKRFGREEQLALNMLKDLESNKVSADNKMLAMAKPETMEKLDTQPLAKPEQKQQEPIIINNQQNQAPQMMAQDADYSPNAPEQTYSGFGRGQINWYS